MTAPEPVDVLPAPRSQVLCSPWASPADVPEVYRGLASDEEWVRLLMQASEILFYLSGRRFYGGGCAEVVTLRSVPPGSGQGAWPYSDTWGSCGCWNLGRYLNGQLMPPAYGMYSGRHLSAMAIKLPRAPVTAITSVLHSGTAFTDWRLTYSGYLERTDGHPWDMCDDSTQVAYTFGVAPPESGVQAAVELAVQLAMAVVGNSQCQLPMRVQSVTRQGISTVVLDPQEFLKDGRTGLYLIDLFLAAINPQSRGQRARMWSPDIPTPVRN